MKRLIAYIDDQQFKFIRLIGFKKVASISCIIRWCIDDYIRSNKDILQLAYDDPDCAEFLQFIDKRSLKQQGDFFDPIIEESLRELSQPLEEK